jgi:hypothetical protein
MGARIAFLTKCRSAVLPVSKALAIVFSLVCLYAEHGKLDHAAADFGALDRAAVGGIGSA